MFLSEIESLINGNLSEHMGIQKKRGLGVPVYSKLSDVRSSPQYEVTFVTQFFGGYVAFTIAAAVFSIITILAMHAYSQFQIIIDMCYSLFVNNEDNSKVDRRLNELDFNRKLKSVVKRHLRILR